MCKSGYVCLVCARVHTCIRFSSCILPLGPEYRLSLLPSLSLILFFFFLSFLYRSLVFFSSSSRSVPEEQIAAPSSRVDRVRKRVSDG